MTTIWKVVTGVALILGIIFGFAAYDDRMVKCDDYEQDVKAMSQVIQNLQMTQDYKAYDFHLESLERDYLISCHSNDQTEEEIRNCWVLKQQIIRTKNKRDDIRDSMR